MPNENALIEKSDLISHFLPTLDRTPMHLAAERGHTGTVEFLADKFKASVFDRTKVGILHTTRAMKLTDLN